MATQFTNQYQMFLSEQPMALHEYARGVVLPRKFEQGGPSWGLGGVCDGEGRFVELSAYDGGWAAHGGGYPWDEEVYEDCEAVYMGLFSRHWGHFLVDDIARLWFFVQHPNRGRQVKLAYLGDEEPDGNFLEFFELLGLEAQQLIHITKPTRFRNVIVPQFACRPCIWYTKEYLSIFDHIAERVREEKFAFNPEVNLQRVYFSRLEFGKAKRTEFGEQMISKWLKANGYTHIPPEQLSLRDQVYIWNHAGTIACLNGSIPINIAFSQKRNLELVVLNKTKLVHKNLELYLLMRPCRMTYVDVYSEPIHGYPKSIGAGPFLLYPGNDLKAYSDANDLCWPFTKSEIAGRYALDFVRLIGAILDVKGRARALAVRLMPDPMKKKLRQLRNAKR